MLPVVSRIVLRYAAGALVAKGLLPDDIGRGLAVDVDVLNLIEIGLGFALAAVSEGWYFLARRFGWAK